MLANLVLENCNNPGTGPLNLSGPPPGRIGFAQAFGTTKCFYVVTDGSQTEEGWTIAGASLARNVIWNSAGTTSPLNLTGTCQVYNTLPAQRAMWADDAGALWNGQGRILANFARGNIGSDVGRLDQIGMQQIGGRITIGQTPGYGTGITNIVFALPAGFSSYAIEFDGVAPQTNGSFVLCRVSNDGAYFYDGVSDYLQQSLVQTNNAPTVTTGDYSYIGVTPGLVSGPAVSGRIDISALSDHGFRMTVRGLISGPAYWSQISNGRISRNVNVPMAAILLGMTGGYSFGTFRLLGGY